MDFQLYDPNKETIYEYLKRVETLKFSIKKDKYNILLDFFNKLLNTKHTTFRNINIFYDNLISKLSLNYGVFDEYRNVFDNWGIKLPVFIDFGSITQNSFDESILDVFKQLLSQIGYTIIKKNNANNMISYRLLNIS